MNTSIIFPIDFIDIFDELDFSKLVELVENGLDFTGLNIFANIDEAQQLAERCRSKKRARKQIVKFIAKVTSIFT